MKHIRKFYAVFNLYNHAFHLEVKILGHLIDQVFVFFVGTLITEFLLLENKLFEAGKNNWTLNWTNNYVFKQSVCKLLIVFEHSYMGMCSRTVKFQ